jgi:hypothetical protein
METTQLYAIAAGGILLFLMLFNFSPHFKGLFPFQHPNISLRYSWSLLGLIKSNVSYLRQNHETVLCPGV